MSFNASEACVPASPVFKNRLAQRLLFLGLAFFAVSAHAQSDEYAVHEKHIERITEAQKVAPLGVDAFGDQISYFTGGLGFNNLDVSIPGNDGLPVELRRSFSVQDRREFTSGPSKKGQLGGFGEWNLDVPHLSGTFKASVGWKVGGSSSTQRCSNTWAPADYVNFLSFDYWSGYQLNIPGGGSESLLHTPNAKLPNPGNGTTYPWITRSLWRISCKPSTKNGYAGEAFLATAPNGTKYHFDYVITRAAPSLKFGGIPGSVPAMDVMQREIVFFMVSRVEDRFGNTVDYTYTGSKLTKIESSDGRVINLTWSGDNITSATSAMGTWTYAYSNGSLVSVTRPDASQWTYGRTGRLFIGSSPSLEFDDPFADCPEGEYPTGNTVVYSVTHPAGATAAFTLAPDRHYRSNVPHYCVKPTSTYEYLQIPNYSDGFTLFSKTVSGPGIPAQTWNYTYSGGHGLAFAYNCGTPGNPLCPASRQVTITGPNQTWERHEYGILYDINEGQLLKRETGSSATNILRTDTSQYISNAEAPTQPFPDLIGSNPLQYADQLADRMRPLKQRTIQQQGVAFTRSITAFNEFGHPLAQSVSGTDSRTETTEYHHDLPKWVIGLPSRQLIDATETSRTDYNASALPWRIYRNGLLTTTLAYNANGTLASVTDGNNHTTTVSGWYRGLPQTVGFPTGHSLTAIVSAQGWITRLTDENGFATNYGYDAMGRVSSVTYPTGDTVAWTAATQAFVRNTVAKYGLPAGHWQQTITQGNYRKETYFDGLWRPVLQREYDNAAATATQRFTGWQHDIDGRATFAGYPRATATSIASFTDGVSTTYDALGRPTLVRQSSELGNLDTVYAYLTDFETRVTNPRLQATTTNYQAFAEPDTSAPILIEAPEGQTTTIVRDKLGAPTQLNRSGVWNGLPQSVSRHYVYDTYRRLCASIEPETGATVMDYDAASNVLWSAAGIAPPTLPSVTACDDARTAAYTSGRRVDRTYDARNRVLTLAFPDGRGNQAWTYTPDGLPSQIATNNSAGGSQVINTYTYNRRRLPETETSQSPGTPVWTLANTYDPLGHLATQGYPSGLVVAFAPNALGQATQAGSYATGAQYFPNGALKQFTYGNGIMHTMAQNARQLPASSIDTGGALSQQFVYDKNGNVTAVTDALDPARSKAMVYDGLDRLTSASATIFGGTGVHQFAYDPLDNLRSWTLGGVKDQSNYVYGADNRLTQIKNTGGSIVHAFSYDPQGNVTTRNGIPHDFDYGNRLRSVGTTESYLYDGHGRRVQTTQSGGSVTRWMYAGSGQMLFSAKGPTSPITHENVYLAGSLVAIIDRDGLSNAVTATKYQHTDALGSPVAMSNEAGAIIERTNYDPYGGPIGKTVNGLGYTGHVMDGATGLTYMQQRYYDQGVGRFLSVDPVTASSVNGGNFNRYKYASNNPYTFLDPDGRQDEKADPPSSTRDPRSMTSRPGLGGASITGAAPYSRALKTLQQTYPEVTDQLVDVAYTRLTHDNPESASEDRREISSEAYSMVPLGGIEVTNSVVGSSGSVAWRVDRDRIAHLLALIHTHGSGGEWFYRYFSTADMGAAKMYSVPVFMSNPDGDFRVYVDGMKTGGRVGAGSSLRLPDSVSQGVLLCAKCIPTK